MTCDEYDQKSKSSVQALTITKQCPACQSNIQNNLPSDHIICGICKYQFCWQCMADYKAIEQNGPHLHQPNCIHFQSLPRKNKTNHPPNQVHVLFYRPIIQLHTVEHNIFQKTFYFHFVFHLIYDISYEQNSRCIKSVYFTESHFKN
jgi:hypothetical protein